ncbi:hypothetical protein DYBT9275_01729 [Dyadobacter sp. CECT 9275]|uniref:Glycosyltransferase n=1 Tax=Dyadobacter helix TaxID=2822344 RepID=A0A916JCN4_9BACT|nr:glycosyltransferase [Dyadobacter sp. CECT 9275]CAG4997262.1 hypothetical protein DYBT9275_01729 [Dyadobacter sp. CECT 9275]
MEPQLGQFIIAYGYLGIFILVYLQETGVPTFVPNELLMLFSGYLAYAGMLDLQLLIGVTVFADFLGTLSLYCIFYFFGSYLLAKKPGWLPVSTSVLDRLRIKVVEGGTVKLFILRITPFVRGYTSCMAGLIRLNPRSYIPIALLSSLAVCAPYIIFGKMMGAQTSLMLDKFSAILEGFLAVVLVLTVLYIGFQIIRFFKNKARESERAAYQLDKTLRIHMVSETEYFTRGQGVHTAFVELTRLMKEDTTMAICVNERGSGHVFHSHTYGPYYFWKGRNYKGRRILTAHVIPDSSRGAIPFWKLLLPLTRRYLKMAYAYADVVIAISPTVEKEIRALGVTSKIVRIPNPVIREIWSGSDEKRNRGRLQLGVADGQHLIIGVGQLQQRKGVEDFIDMAISMPDSRFVWVGGRPMGLFTEGIARINQRIENAPSNVFFTGLLELDDMPSMYAAADIFLFPSYQENCPLAPLEAAAAGLPVVFRDIAEYTSLFQAPYLKASSTPEFVDITKKLIGSSDFYQEAVEMSAKLIAGFDKETIKAEINGGISTENGPTRFPSF